MGEVEVREMEGMRVKMEGMGGVGEMLEMGDVYYVGVVGEGEE